MTYLSLSIANVKAHKEQVLQRERNILSREQALSQREAQHEADAGTLQITLSHTQEQLTLAQAQIAELQAALLEARSQPSSPSSAELTAALAARDAEHAERAAARDAQVAAAWDAREAELLRAVRARELELEAAWSAREEAIIADATAAVETKARVMAEREKEVAEAWEHREDEIRERWSEMEAELQVRVKAREAEVQAAWEEREARMEQEANERLKLAVQRVWDELRRSKDRLLGYECDADRLHPAPSLADESFEEWHSIADVSTSTDGTDEANTTVMANDTVDEDALKTSHCSALAEAMYKTPINPATGRLASRFLKTPLPALTKGLLEATSPPTHADLPSPPPSSGLTVPVSIPGSAMRGVVLTSTGQPLATPAPTEFLKLFARPLSPSPKTLDFGQAKEDAAEVEAALTREDGYGDVTPQPLEKRALLPNAPALRGNLAKDKVKAPAMRRGRTSATSVTSVLGPSSPRKLNQRPVSPGKERGSRASSDIKVAPSASDVKKNERPLTRTFTAPALGAGSGARTGRPSLSGAPKKSRESLSAASPKTQAQPDARISSSSSSSVHRSGLSASDSSATSTEPDTTDTALPPLKEKTTSRKLGRAVNVASSVSTTSIYDLDDEENLPSPFLKRVNRDRFATTSGSGTGSTVSSRAKAAASTSAPQLAPTTAITKTKSGSVSAAAGRRLSQANLLRVVAAKNATRTPSPGRSSEAPPAASKRPAPND
jgi:NIMA (never in mitosis gene a)-related kinase 2